jgi:hypothetical protein
VATLLVETPLQGADPLEGGRLTLVDDGLLAGQSGMTFA